MATHTFDFGGIDHDFDFNADEQVFTVEITETEIFGDMIDDSLISGEEVMMSINGGPPSTAEFIGTNAAGDPVFFSVGEAAEIVLSDGMYSTDLNVVNFGTYSPICFATGTLILTPEGDVPIEALKRGDLVQVSQGGSVPVKWIGRQTVSKLFTPREHFRPVRIVAGALGDNVPDTDLVLTKDHGLVMDGLIAHAGALVNGVTITEVSMAELADRETYWHIETEGHEVILANGVPAETFVDNVSRHAFDNYAEFEALYGADSREMTELELPRATTPRQVPQRIRRLIAERALKQGMVTQAA